MDEQLGLLVELQKLDSEIIALDRTIKAMPARFGESERPSREAEAAMEGHKKRVQEAEKKKRAREAEVEEMRARVEKLRQRTSEIKDNKAYQAHMKEIEAAQQKAYAAEDDILALMEEVEREAAKGGAFEEALRAANDKALREKEAMEAEVAAAREGLERQMACRNDFARRLGRENYDLYMKLLKEKGGLAVTAAAGEICTGCNMNIMPQLYVELKKNDRIFQCPQCQRILFYSESPENPQ